MTVRTTVPALAALAAVRVVVPLAARAGLASTHTGKLAMAIA